MLKRMINEISLSRNKNYLGCVNEMKSLFIYTYTYMYMDLYSIEQLYEHI